MIKVAILGINPVNHLRTLIHKIQAWIQGLVSFSLVLWDTACFHHNIIQQATLLENDATIWSIRGTFDVSRLSRNILSPVQELSLSARLRVDLWAYLQPKMMGFQQNSTVAARDLDAVLLFSFLICLVVTVFQPGVLWTSKDWD
jgi:hypothetical protein